MIPKFPEAIPDKEEVTASFAPGEGKIPSNILKALIDSGITVGVSSRGMGSLEQRGQVMEVQDDFELLCWDFVSTPSNPNSFMHTLKEGKEFAPFNYTQVNSIVHEILCSKGSCPVF